LAAQEFIKRLKVGGMCPSEHPQSLDGGFELLGEGIFPDHFVVLLKVHEAGDGLEFLKSFPLVLVAVPVHFLLVVLLQKSVLNHEFLHTVPAVESAVVLLQQLELDVDLLLAIIIPELKIGQQQLRILIVLYFELVPLLVVVLCEIGLSADLDVAGVVVVDLLVLRFFPVGSGGDRREGSLVAVVALTHRRGLVFLLEERFVI
jgi:hypothetical protein